MNSSKICLIKVCRVGQYIITKEISNALSSIQVHIDAIFENRGAKIDLLRTIEPFPAMMCDILLV